MFGISKACRELAEWCHETQQENDRLKAENDKLREFVADLMAYLKEAERVHSDRLIPDLYYDRARELGVEVTR